MKKKRINITTTQSLENRINKFLEKEGYEYLNRSMLDNIAVDYYMAAMDRKRKVKREG